MLPLQALQPNGLIRAAQFPLRFLGQRQIVDGMRIPRHLLFPVRAQHFQGIFADCF